MAVVNEKDPSPDPDAPQKVADLTDDSIVFLSSRDSGGGRHVHLDHDCRLLDNASPVYQRTAQQLRPGWEICAECTGNGDTGGLCGDPNKIRRQLLSLDPSDVGLSPRHTHTETDERPD